MTGRLAAMLVACAAAGAGASDGETGAGAKRADDEFIEVKVQGTLSAGLVAIGGETTGYAIKARGVTWELDFRRNQRLRALADGLDGKRVLVTGTLEARPGVEIRQRSIVTVRSLAPAAQK